MRKHVLIPMYLLDKIIELFELYGYSELRPDARYDHDVVLWALYLKRYNSNPFKTFDRAVAAALSEEAHEAAREHLQKSLSAYGYWDSDQPF